MFVSILCGKIVIEINLNEAPQDLLNFVIHKINAGISKKCSKSSCIIRLSKISKKKKSLRASKTSGNMAKQLAQIMDNSTVALTDMPSVIKFLNSKIEKKIIKKMKKSFNTHLELLRIAIQELQYAPLSDLFKIAQSTQNK